MIKEGLKATQDETQRELGRDSLKERQGALNRQTAVRLAELSQMPLCPNCGERTPDMLNCPFCEDMSEQASQEPAGEVVSWLVGLMGRREMEVVS